jgi:cell fate regulator YaaT (PSP1 superfamily)
MAEPGRPTQIDGSWAPPASIDEARARARDRFKSRLKAGEAIGECGCGEDDEIVGQNDGSPPERVVGVRFRDSGRIYYFRPAMDDLRVGDWVVVPTNRGQEAARVVMEQHHVRQAQLQGDLGSVVRRLNDDDVGHMEALRRERAGAIKTFGEISRARRLGIKAIAADYSFDGSAITLSYSVPDRERAPEAGTLRDLAREAASVLGCRVELHQVGPRDEARLLGGLGRCGRTLCCSSWLPVFPEISMSMAKNQDLPLNPAKVSGVCGRLLCCLSYENDQYRQMKAVMPKLGQTIETPGGMGQVVSMQLLKELVTVRLEPDNIEATFRCDELGLGTARVLVKAVEAVPPPLPTVEPEPSEPNSSEPDASSETQEPPVAPSRRRRRRRSGRRGTSEN